MAEAEEPQDNNGDFEEISKGDIAEVIEAKFGTTNFVILDYTLEALSQRTGLLGDHSTLYVNLLNAEGEEVKLSFFVKYFPKMEAPAKFADGIGAFKKEIFVYGLFEKFKKIGIDMITSVVPTCYLSRHNKYLVMDNLVGEGFQTLDKHKYLDYDSVLIVLQSLARLHASSLIYEERKSAELERIYRLTDEYEENLEESFFNDRDDFINARGVEASIKCVVNEIKIFDFPDTLVSGKSFTQIAREICYKIYDLVKPSKRFRNVLSHGDLWVTNFLLKFSRATQQFAGCKFVDFQCGRYVPPSQDVLSVLYLTTSRDFRKKHMYQVVGMYYSYLEKHMKVAGFELKDIIPFSEFMDSCEDQKPFAIVQTAIYFPLILISSDLVEIYFSDKELNEKALFEDRSTLVLAHMHKDDSYRSRLKDSIQDLKDYCEYR